MDFLFGSIEVFQLAGLITTALLMLIITAAIIVDYIWWSLKAKVYKAEVSGVKAKPGTRQFVYYPIFQFKSEKGQYISAETNFGTSLLLRVLPGSEADILVMDHDKNTARVKSILRPFLSGLSLVFSLMLFYISFTQYSFSLSAFFIIFLFISVASFFLYKILFYNGLKGAFELINKRQAQRKIKREEYPVLGKKQVIDKIKKQDQLKIKCFPAGIVIGLFLLGVGINLGLDQKYLVETGIRTEGQVVKIYSEVDINTKANVYYPIIEFADQKNRSITFRDKIGSTPSEYNVGETVTVLFDPNNLGKAMIDRNVWNWLPAFILLILGTAVVFSCIQGLFAIRIRISELPIEQLA
jgi:hypothetical protein